MRRAVPEDARAFAAQKLAELPVGTRLVLVWDPDRWLPDDELADSAGRIWRVFTYDGSDLQLAARWRAERRTVERIIVRGSPPPHDRHRMLDLSYLDWLIPNIEQFIDLSIGAILSSFAPGEAWHAGVANDYGVMLGRDLRRAALAYKAIRDKVGNAVPLAEPHVRAMALATAVKGLDATDVLFSETDPTAWLKQYLRAAIRAEGQAYLEPVREQARATLPAAFLRPWVDTSVADAVRLLYAVLALRSLDVEPDPVTIRGLALIANPDPLLDGIPTAARTLDDFDLRMAVVKTAEGSLSTDDLKRIVSVRERVSSDEIASVVSTAPPRVAWTVLRRELLAASALADPLSFVAAWHPISSEIQLGQEASSAIRALNLLKSVLERIQQKPLPESQDVEGLVCWYVESGATLEYDVSAAGAALRQTRDREVREKWDPVVSAVRNRVRRLLHEADTHLAASIRDSLDFIRRKDLVINVVRDLLLRPGRVPPRIPAVWLIVFDGMRWDTWERVVRPLIEQEFEIQEVRPYLAILPSKTDISRTSLVAGQLPSYWRTPEGKWTKNEEYLASRLFNLKPSDARADYQFKTRADEDVRHDLEKGRKGRAAKYNVLIYNVSDDWLHDYRKDVFQLNRDVERLLREVILPDMTTFIGDGELVVVSSDHGFVELDRNDGEVISVPMSSGGEAAQRLTEANITYRYLREVTNTDVERPTISWSNLGTFTLAVGHRWFQRPGQGASFARYSHGGISLEEMVVPGALLARATSPVTRLEWKDPPRSLSLKEDEPWEGVLVIANTGTRTATFDVKAQSAEVILDPTTGSLKPGNDCSIRVRIIGYPTAGHRRVDITGSYCHEGGEVLKLPLLSISVDVAERLEKVVFSDALDLLDEA